MHAYIPLITLYFIHYATLRYVTLQYITLHAYIHTYPHDIPIFWRHFLLLKSW
jgi:hypothetical protein